MVSASRSPASVPSPTQATHPSGRINTAAVEIGHPTTVQRVSLPEVVVDVKTGDHPGEPPASLVHAQQVGDGVALGVAGEHGLRHGVLQHAGTGRGRSA